MLIACALLFIVATFARCLAAVAVSEHVCCAHSDPYFDLWCLFLFYVAQWEAVVFAVIGSVCHIYF